MLKSDIPDVLRIYDTVRRPFGNDVVERARLAGFLYEFNNVPPNVNVAKAMKGSREELLKLSAEIHKKWELMWASLPDKEWDEARALLDTLRLSNGPLAIPSRL